MADGYDENFQTPRVNVGLLAQYPNDVVCLVGKIKSQDANEGIAVLEASDGQEIQIIMSPGNTYTTSYVQIMGTAEEGRFREFLCLPLGESFDLANYNKLVEFQNGKFKDLFSGPKPTEA